MVTHAYNLSTQEAKAKELRVPAQAGLNSKTLSQKKEKKEIPLTYTLLLK
jgi:hypothetical protein